MKEITVYHTADQHLIGPEAELQTGSLQKRIEQLTHENQEMCQDMRSLRDFLKSILR
jgi:hypothetical protein